jgi:glutamate racemase
VERIEVDPRPIGIFDSGVGGLSILSEIVRLLPNEDTIYFADSANCPYGQRAHSEIGELSRAIVRFLLESSAKVVVVACNTASAVALSALRSEFPHVPFVGMVPALKPATLQTRNGRIGILATPTTLEGQLFADVVSRFGTDVEIISRACPGLVEQVESGDVLGPETVALLERYVESLLNAGIDTLILGCTHYPFLTPTIRNIVGEDIAIVDPSPAIARQTARVLAQSDLLRNDDTRGNRKYYTTGDGRTFRRVLKTLIGDSGTVIEVRWHGHHSGMSVSLG